MSESVTTKKRSRKRKPKIQLTERLLKLPAVFAEKYRKLGLSGWIIEQLEGECTLALVKGINSYDPKKDKRSKTDYRGETYIYQCLKHAAYKFLERNLGESRLEPNLTVSTIDQIYTDRVVNGHNEETERVDSRLDAEYHCKRIRKMLHEKHYNLLYKVYGLDIKMTAIAKQRKVSAQAIQSTVSSLTSKLRSKLEGEIEL